MKRALFLTLILPLLTVGCLLILIEALAEAIAEAAARGSYALRKFYEWMTQ